MLKTKAMYSFGNHVPDYTVSQLKIPYYESLPLRKP
jgi:hypothetical protein